MICDKQNVSLAIVDCLLYTRRIAPKENYHKKRMYMLAYTPVDTQTVPAVSIKNRQAQKKICSL